jgi:hypothetical protein
MIIEVHAKGKGCPHVEMHVISSVISIYESKCKCQPATVSTSAIKKEHSSIGSERLASLCGRRTSGAFFGRLGDTVSAHIDTFVCALGH